MTIHLPENLESSIREAVHSGQFPSVDEAMAEASCRRFKQIKQHPPRQTRAMPPDIMPRPKMNPAARSCSVGCSTPGCSARSSRRSPT